MVRILRALRLAVRVALMGVVVGVFAVLLALAVALRSEAVFQQVVTAGLPALDGILPGRIEAEQASGRLLGPIELRGIKVLDEHGDTFITADGLRIDFDALDLGAGVLGALRLRLDRPWVRVHQRDDRSWNVQRAFAPPSTEPPEPGPPITLRIGVPHVEIVDGSVVVERPGAAAVEVHGIHLDGGWSMDGPDQDIVLRELRFEPRAPWPVGETVVRGGLAVLSGALVVDDLELEVPAGRLWLSGTTGPFAALAPDLRAELDSFDLAFVRIFVPSAPLTGRIGASLRLWGTPSDLSLDGQILAEDGGRIDVDLLRYASGAEVPEHELRARLTGFNLGSVLDFTDLPEMGDLDVRWAGRGIDAQRIEGTLAAKGSQIDVGEWRLDEVDLEGAVGGGVFTLQSVAARALGASLTAGGSVAWSGGPVAVDAKLLLPDSTSLPPRWTAGVAARALDLKVQVNGRWEPRDGARPTFGGAAELWVVVGSARFPGGVVGKSSGHWEGKLKVEGAGPPVIEGPVVVDVVDLQAGGERIDSAHLEVALTEGSADVQLRASRSGVEDGPPAPSPPPQSEGAQAERGPAPAEVVDASAAAVPSPASPALLSPESPVPVAAQTSPQPATPPVDPPGPSPPARLKLPVELVLGAKVIWSAWPAIEVETSRADLRYGAVSARQEGPLRLAFRKGVVRVQGLDVDLGLARLRGSVRHDPAADTDADLSLQGLDLARLSPFLPDGLGLSGSVENLRVTVGGTLHRPALSVAAAASDLRLGSRGPITLAVDAAHGASVRRGRIDAGTLGVLSWEQLPLDLRFDGADPPWFLEPTGPLGLAWELPRQELAALLRLGGVEGDDIPKGLTTARLTVGGTVAAPTVEFQSTLSDVLVGGQIAAVRLAASLDGGVVRLTESTVRTAKDGTVLELEGEARAPLGPYLVALLGPAGTRGPPPRLLADPQLTVRLRKLPMPIVHALVPALTPLTGAIQGELVVRGSARDPVVDLDLRLLGARLGRRALDQAALDLALTGGKLAGRIEALAEGGGRLAIQPRVSLPLVFDGSRTVDEMFGQPDLRAEVSGIGFPVALLAAFVPGATDPAGALDVLGLVTGSLLDPQPRLEAGFADARFCLDATSVCYEDAQLRLHIDPQRVRLEELSARTVPVVQDVLDAGRRPAFDSGPRPHRATLKGEVLLDKLRPTTLDLSLDLEDTWLVFTRETKAQAKGSVRATGTVDRPILRGDVTLNSLTVDLGRDATNRDAAPRYLPDVLRIHRTTSRPGPGERRPLAEDGGPTLLGRLDAAVALHLGNFVRIKLAVGVARQSHEVGRALNLLGSIEPDLSLGGDLSIRLQSGRTTLEGQVTTGVDSRLGILTKRFDMEEGSSLTFVGDPLDTRLGLRAGYRSQYGTITAVVGGTPADPTLDWESETFSEPADMISVVVTGKPMDELSAAEGGQVQTGLTSFLSGFATKIAGKVVPLDSVDLQLEDGFKAGSFEAGKALAPGLVLFVVIRWGAADDENRIEAQLQFQIDRRTYLETSMGDRAKGAAEVRWRVQF